MRAARPSPRRSWLLSIPDHLRFNIRVVDLNGATLAEGRDLLALKCSVRGRDGKQVEAASAAVHRSWDFGELAAEQSVERRGLRFTVYPTLRIRGDGVELTEAASAADAQSLLRAAVLRLAVLTLPEQFKYARKKFADQRAGRSVKSSSRVDASVRGPA